MPIAVGIYLPLSLDVPILIGGFIRHLINRKRMVEESKDPGILFSSGLIAGESLMGILIALFIFLKWDLSINSYVSNTMIVFLSVAAIVIGSFFLWNSARKDPDAVTKK